MTKKTLVALAAAALACGVWTSAASAKQHPKHVAEPKPAPVAAEIQGVNPMTNAKPIPPVANKLPYHPVPGVNPL